MSENLFAWQGFSVALPTDWSPISFSGSRRQGFSHISTPGQTQMHIRWQSYAGNPEPSKLIEKYFRGIQRDSKRTGNAFSSEQKPIENGAEYLWDGAGTGRGCLFLSEPSQRIFFLELWKSSGTVSLSKLHQIQNSFQDFGNAEPDQWAILGLSIALPKVAEVKKTVLQSGRLQVHWAAKAAVISAGRSSFGKELLGKNSLAEWASSLAPKGKIEEGQDGVQLESVKKSLGRPVFTLTLAKFVEETNQLLYVTSMHRDPVWRPQWAWFN